jgi:formyl-CoA transferase
VDDERLADFRDTIGKLRERGSTYDELQEQYQKKLSFIRVNNTYYRTYQARDGVLAVGCLSDPLRKKLLKVLGLEDVRFQPGYDPLSEESEASDSALAKRAETIFREKSVGEWLTLLDAAGVPAGPVRFVEELLDDEHVIANNLVVEMEHSLAGKLRMVGPMVRMSETPVEAKSASPALGEHSAEILGDLGYSAEEIQRLKDEGVTA